MYEEETDSEPDEEESQYTPEDEFIEEDKQEDKKKQLPKKTHKIFDYLNKDAKSYKQ